MPLRIHPPEYVHSRDGEEGFRQSWPKSFPTAACAAVLERTRRLSGAISPFGARKLFETAWNCASVVLEVGDGHAAAAAIGLAAAVEARVDQNSLLQWYRVEHDQTAIDPIHWSLGELGLQKHCLLYHGSLGTFRHDVPISPTMVVF